jgi:hypothetical protein
MALEFRISLFLPNFNLELFSSPGVYAWEWGIAIYPFFYLVPFRGWIMMVQIIKNIPPLKGLVGKLNTTTFQSPGVNAWAREKVMQYT